MRLFKKIAFIIILISVSGFLIYGISNNNKIKALYKGTPDFFPDKVDFCAEETPLQILDVKERFDRELVVNTNLHGSTILIMKRANRVFPIIEPILEKNGVPDDFKYLAVIESALINATSSSGAKGVWQFMPETAREKGMEVNDVVDERYHLVKSTEAACQYLLAAKAKLGSWTMAAASYNGGMAGVSKQIEIQRVNNYYDLLLTDETYRYVFRILALKEIMKNPALYGFNLQTEKLYPNIATRKIQVDSTITNLADFAIKQGVNYKTLKIFNPWLRDTKLDNKLKKQYELELPVL
ncbi:MAG: lytic transglycosylase domain-containing protein [Flavobacterium sp.]|nr:lytic transglycosylase domain-containing protein [Flavobacterium sp.]